MLRSSLFVHHRLDVVAGLAGIGIALADLVDNLLEEDIVPVVSIDHS